MGNLNVENFKAHAVNAESFLARWGPALLTAFALIYYAQYFRYGLNLGGEGGTNAVLAMRLMDGQRPIVDTFLGYNLMWFYPLVAIFKFTGPDYLAMRLFFFVLSGANALLGYAIVRSVTRQAWLAVFVGVLLVLVPGMMFRNYMGLIGVLSSLLLLKAYVLPAGSSRSQILWMAVAGAGMTLCFLLRIEPSLLISVVWLGLAFLYPLGSRIDFGARLRTTVLGTAAGLAIFLAIHTGVAWHAHNRGFGPEFIGQYASFVGLLRYELHREVEKVLSVKDGTRSEANASPNKPNTFPGTECPAQQGAQLAPQPTRALCQASITQAEPSANDSSVYAAPAAPVGSNEGARSSPREARLDRPELLKVWQAERPRERYFGVCLYYPIFWSIAFVGTAAIMLVVAVFSGNIPNKIRALVVLTTTGCSLSLFPQYFFFRPDAPHLSEFMVPFLPAVACSTWVTCQAAHEAKARIWRVFAYFLAAGSAALVPIYLKAIMPRESAGTIFSLDRPTEFRALNGVSVLLPANEVPAMEGLRDAILNHSKPGEFVLVYPYAPTINFMTDRPSYEYNLYIDDSAADSPFQIEAQERIEKNKPAVIVIDNRPINQTEASRFKNWAAQLMAYIRSNYVPAGSFQIGRREIDVYVRPDKMRANTHIEEPAQIPAEPATP